MDLYYLSTLLALPTLILCESPPLITLPPPPLPVCKDVVVNCASMLARCDNIAMQVYCKKSCGVCEDVPKLIIDKLDTPAGTMELDTKEDIYPVAREIISRQEHRCIPEGYCAPNCPTGVYVHRKCLNGNPCCVKPH